MLVKRGYFGSPFLVPQNQHCTQWLATYSHYKPHRPRYGLPYHAKWPVYHHHKKHQCRKILATTHARPRPRTRTRTLLCAFWFKRVNAIDMPVNMCVCYAWICAFWCVCVFVTSLTVLFYKNQYLWLSYLINFILILEKSFVTWFLRGGCNKCIPLLKYPQNTLLDDVHFT